MNSSPEEDTRELLTKLWRDAEPSVQAYVFAAIRDFQHAEDVIQQVALTAARRFHDYDRSRPFVAWVLWLAKFRIADHYREVHRSKVVFSETLLERLAQILASPQPPERSARHAALEHCIEKLPPKARTTLHLRYSEDLSMNEIARRLDSTSGSVRVTLTRLRDALAECIRQRLARENSL